MGPHKDVVGMFRQAALREGPPMATKSACIGPVKTA